MSIRLRSVNGYRIALCAVESDPLPGDLYLDDADHYALAAKFCLDWQGKKVDWSYPEEWEAMATQKVRDAHEEAKKWDKVFADLREMVELIGTDQLVPPDEESRKLCDQIAEKVRNEVEGPSALEAEEWLNMMTEWVLNDPNDTELAK